MDKGVRVLHSILALTHIHQRQLTMNPWDSLPACLPAGVRLTQVLGKP